MLRFSDARNFGRTLTGLALIVGPALMLVGAIISPDTMDDNKLKELNKVAAHKSSFILSALLFLLATLILLAASVGIIHLFRGRRVTLGQIAGSLLLVGGTVTVAFFTFSIVEYEMVNQSGLDRVQMAKFLDKANNSASTLPLFILFIVGIVLGLILLAVAAWRAKLIPIWAAVLILLGGLLGFATQSKVGDIVDNALLLVGVGMLGRAVLSMSDEEWDAPREPQAGRAPAVPASA
jgi:uncharacterized membrane protein YcfT